MESNYKEMNLLSLFEKEPTRILLFKDHAPERNYGKTRVSIPKDKVEIFLCIIVVIFSPTLSVLLHTEKSVE